MYRSSGSIAYGLEQPLAWLANASTQALYLSPAVVSERPPPTRVAISCGRLSCDETEQFRNNAFGPTIPAGFVPERMNVVTSDSTVPQVSWMRTSLYS